MIDLTTTNLLLGILAGVAVLQMSVLIAGGVIAWRTYNRTMDRVEALEQRVQNAVAPLAARASIIMDRLDRVAERVDHGTEKLDYALALTSHGAQVAMTAVNGNVQRTAALAAALASGGRAALRAWRTRGAADREVRNGHPGSDQAGAASRVPVEIQPESSSSYINHHRTEDSHVSI
jgi:hypothetical protein